MIAFDSDTKQAYKNNDREIKVMGNLYLAKKRVSKNIFNVHEQPIYYDDATIEINNNNLKVLSTTIGTWNYIGLPLETSKILGKTIYFNSNYTSTSLYPAIYLYGYKNGDLVGNLLAGQMKQETSSGTLYFDYTFPSTIPIEYDTYVLLFYCNTYLRSNAQLDDYTIYSKIMVSDENADYEEYGVYVNDYNSILKTGKNLLNADEYFNKFKENRNFKFSKSANEYYNTTGRIYINDIGLKVDNDYVFSINILSNNNNHDEKISIVYYDTHEDYIAEESSISSKTGVQMLQFTIPGLTKSIELRVNRSFDAQDDNVLIVNDIQLEKGETRTSYEPYNILESRNLFDINFVEWGKYNVYNNESGPYTNAFIGYVNIVAGNKYSISMSSTSNTRISYQFLDSSNNVLSGQYYSAPTKNYYWEGITAPNNATKLLISQLDSAKNDIINIQVEEGTSISPFERYNSTPFKLTEENECKILGFNINEKTDIYYTSLPYNTMEIEVDNEKGYFTDYDPDSIVNKLNTDCYVDLFMNINDGDYKKIMTMNFDKISSSDYEKAKLSFKSNISTLSNLTLRDKNNLFSNANQIYKNDFINYLKDNYNINLLCDNTTNDLMYIYGYTTDMTPQRMLLHAGTRYGTLEKAVLTLNDSQDNLVQRTWKSSPQDTILLDYQQEKPIVKREDVYRGVQRKYINLSTWESSTETFDYSLSGKLTSARESITLFNSQYKINDLTNNNITIIGNVSVSVSGTNAYELLNIYISGNIGNEYTITLNKSNITKKINDYYIDENIGSIDDTTKILKITEKAPLQSGYYNFILSEKQVKSNIEAKIFGLPYLEIGDTVEIETENAKILMTIAEIDMNFDGGLLETIKGYELGWDALFPSDTLYPSDDLYPNTPI